MKIGLQNVRCDCLSKANIYWDGEKAYCPVCKRQAIVEYINGVPDGVMPMRAVIL